MRAATSVRNQWVTSDVEPSLRSENVQDRGGVRVAADQSENVCKRIRHCGLRQFGVWPWAPWRDRDEQSDGRAARGRRWHADSGAYRASQGTPPVLDAPG